MKNSHMHVFECRNCGASRENMLNHRCVYCHSLFPFVMNNIFDTESDLSSLVIEVPHPTKYGEWLKLGELDSNYRKGRKNELQL